MIRISLAVVLAMAACTPAAVTPTVTPSPTAPGGPTDRPAVTQPTIAPPASPARSPGPVTLKEFPVPAGSSPHDVAPAADGGVWYTAQRSGELGWLDPSTGRTKHVKLGQGSSPHGVIVGPDGAPWITDSGLNAIVRVDPRTSEVSRYPLPGGNVNLNTAAFEPYPSGRLWFTGQSGSIGHLDVDVTTGQAKGPYLSAAPGGAGPYGITSTPRGDVYYASLAGSHIAHIRRFVVDRSPSGIGFEGERIEPLTARSGPRRVWSDSKGVIWVSEWNAGQLGRYDPITKEWKEWKLPGARPQAYAVFVDDRDIVWLSDFGASAIVRFDPATERFDAFPHTANGNVRQIHGRPGEVWGALSGLDKLLLVSTR